MGRTLDGCNVGFDGENVADGLRVLLGRDVGVFVGTRVVAIDGIDDGLKVETVGLVVGEFEDETLATVV